MLVEHLRHAQQCVLALALKVVQATQEFQTVTQKRSDVPLDYSYNLEKLLRRNVTDGRALRKRARLGARMCVRL
jgi:hypothetical protein